MKKARNMKRYFNHILMREEADRTAEFIKRTRPEIPSLVNDLC